MRLIDADELLKHTCYIETGDLNGYEIIYPYEVEKAPIVDAVPVVRCKECENRNTAKCPIYPQEYEDDYCSFGERRNDDRA